PLWVYLLASLIGGFVWTFLFVAQSYYVKYAFGVENFGTQTALLGLLSIGSFIIGTIVSQWVLKVKGITPAQGFIFAYGLSVLPLVVLWLLNLSGPIRSIIIFYPLMFLAMLGIGMGFVPGNLIRMETMDYNKDKVGKGMQGTLTSLTAFSEKVQAAIASAVTGLVLAAVGYNAELYQDATTIPAELFQGLGLVMFGVPALLGIITIAVMAFYPLLKADERAAMYAEIEARKLQAESIQLQTQ
ncbi:MAG: MFS transporter, partial [Caldilinea sp.]|nr:MFS transporter [Caldilinea sp.]MDW8440994.1 MFS transporter [Caldilineaceae bacterium]